MADTQDMNQASRQRDTSDQNDGFGFTGLAEQRLHVRNAGFEGGPPGRQFPRSLSRGHAREFGTPFGRKPVKVTLIENLPPKLRGASPAGPPAPLTAQVRGVACR